MDETTKRRIAKLGLKLKDFEPNPNEEKNRIADLEDAVLELAEIISEVME